MKNTKNIYILITISIITMFLLSGCLTSTEENIIAGKLSPLPLTQNEENLMKVAEIEHYYKFKINLLKEISSINVWIDEYNEGTYIRKVFRKEITIQKFNQSTTGQISITALKRKWENNTQAWKLSFLGLRKNDVSFVSVLPAFKSFGVAWAGEQKITKENPGVIAILAVGGKVFFPQNDNEFNELLKDNELVYVFRYKVK